MDIQSVLSSGGGGWVGNGSFGAWANKPKVSASFTRIHSFLIFFESNYFHCTAFQPLF